MGLYTGVDRWVNSIYQFEETDLVQADTDNIPLQNLADRTLNLLNKVGLANRLQDQIVLSASSFIPTQWAGHAFVVSSTDIVDLTLERASLFKRGTIMVFNSFCTPNSVINIRVQPGDYIYDSDGSVDVMYMHHKEHLILMAVGTNWIVLNATGNFYCAGEEIKARRNLINTLRYDGGLYERARYPRLWKFVSTLTLWQELVPEDLWWQSDVIYRGCFSIGNGVTTFRVPDERGMADRMLDLGRGKDLNRYHNFAGGYEPDSLKYHAHSYRDRYFRENIKELQARGAGAIEWLGGQNNGIGSAETDNDNDYATYIDATTSQTGESNETAVKNIGKLNLVKF